LDAARWFERSAAQAGAAVAPGQPEVGSAALVALLEDLVTDLSVADLRSVDFWSALFPPALLAPVVLRTLCRRKSC
jgi:hypothetical protein